MRNRYVTTLLTFGVVAVFLLGMAPAAEAELIKICKRYRPSGPKVCYYVESGSVDATVIAKGVSGKLANYCDGLAPGEGDCFIVIEFAIFGDIPPEGEGADYCRTFTNAGTLPGGTLLFPEVGFSSEPCLIEGQAICFNPQDKYNQNGTAFNLAGPLTESAEIITCTKGGTCITEATLGLFDDNGGVCNNNWTLDFTPYYFYGQVAFCPGGYTDPPFGGQCCATDRRAGPGDQECYKNFQVGEPNEGQPGFLWTYCKLPDNCFKNGQPTTACFDKKTDLLKPGVEFDCVELDLPSECVDTKDPDYDPSLCFDVYGDGSIIPGLYSVLN
jgi:hypothetical protein